MQVLAASFPEADMKTRLLAETEEGSRFSIFKQSFSTKFSINHLLQSSFLMIFENFQCFTNDRGSKG